jgi:hypothetical protein
MVNASIVSRSSRGGFDKDKSYCIDPKLKPGESIGADLQDRDSRSGPYRP